MILTAMVLADAPTCAMPNAAATVVHAAAADYPASARDLGIGPVTILVAVTIDANGKLVDAHILRSSNNMALDQTALRAARNSSYSPTIVNCQATTGSYIFRVAMDPANSVTNSYVSCAMPNRPPYVVHAVAPAEPLAAANLAVPVTVRVRVTVGPDGSVRDARVFQSSNISSIDDAVLRAARQSQYEPQVLACVSVAGTYIFSASFGPHE